MSYTTYDSHTYTHAQKRRITFVCVRMIANNINKICPVCIALSCFSLSFSRSLSIYLFPFSIDIEWNAQKQMTKMRFDTKKLNRENFNELICSNEKKNVS